MCSVEYGDKTDDQTMGEMTISRSRGKVIRNYIPGTVVNVVGMIDSRERGEAVATRVMDSWQGRNGCVI